MQKIELGQVIAFYFVALGLAVVVATLGKDLGDGALALTMGTPAVAVFVIFLLFVPKGARRDFFRNLGLRQFGTRGLSLAIAAPALIFGCGSLLLLWLGATTIRPDATGSLPRIVISSAIGFVISIVLALGEEVGWRGYLLPKLIPLGAVTAMLAVGFLHGVWHLPLILLTDLYHPSGNRLLVIPMFLATLTLAGLFYGYLRVTTASIWPVAIAHAAVNAFWSISENISQTSSPLVSEYVGGESGIVMILGLLLLALLLTHRLRQ